MAKLVTIKVSVKVKEVELDSSDLITNESDREEKVADLQRNIVIRDDDYDKFVDNKLWELLHRMSDRAARLAITN